MDLEILEDMEKEHERFDILGRIANAKFPVYLIQGTEDGDKRRNGSASLAAKHTRTQWIQVPSGDHTFGTVHPFRGETEPLKQAIEASKEAIRSMLQASF
ncbi:hypothetical protein [Paenibacillus hexagrammi]|uniref:hypothetical protein n=1 Tax=Paenibacillus hexagrammi TaxID=2908839 RepID=UPI002882E778|nr:hypothetical protein [Paenibacillus sp. YPD9-1]